MSKLLCLLAGLDSKQAQQVQSAWQEIGCSKQNLLQTDSAHRALDICSTQQPKLVLLGKGLTDMSTLELLAKIKTHGCQIPVCLLLSSRQDEKKDLLQAFDLGVQDVLFEPLDARELALRLELGLCKARQRQTLLHFQDLAAKAGLGYWEYALGEGKFYASEALQGLLGYVRQQAPQGCELLDAHFYEQDVQKLKRNLQSLDPGECFELELTCRRLDREERYIRIQGQKEVGMENGLVAGLFQDITQQKRVQNKLMELLEHSSMQAAALEQSGEGIVLTDQNFRVVYVNPFFDQVSGFKASELIFNLLSRQSKGTDQVGEAFVDQNWRGQLSLEDKNGVQRQVEATLSAVKNWSGQVVNFVLLVRDITEKLQLQQQLQQAQKMEAIGTLAGGIAHDFNNMLMGMQGFTELALSNLDQDSKAAKHLHSVLQTSTRAKDLVQQILTFSRQSESDKKPLQVKTVLKEVLKLLQATLPANIELLTNIDPEPPQILADPSQVQQVIMNLCTNAVQAMPDGGKLLVSLQGKSIDGKYQERPEDLEPGEYLLLQVQDTGQGMEQELAQRIFDPFFTTKPRGQGTGLGLSVVHGILQEIGGSISVQSSPGEGTLFRVNIPVLQETGWEVQEQAQLHQGVVRGRGNILFVDDQQDIVRWGVRALEGLGYRVFGTSDSSRAWEVIRQGSLNFDLVVTDLSMPGLSGLEFLQKIKERNPALPVILCTGHSSEQAEKSPIVEQAEAVLYKPFSIAEFSNLVRSLILHRSNAMTA
ncbi:MAG: response regulator, partial [Desulfohalobiaceae bacterium]